ncbi:MAG: YkgJ family cysteine cluster protein [Clostridia bacterium]|nr:YkgJ family cysteine cluster protein [Clostridia bacterium]MDQ7790731.1 YkgJ family cysteine cluster protein [Clostridia bacterium]
MTAAGIQVSGEGKTLDQKFRFLCRPGLACFNECCRDIYILLTPYDVLRIKNTLGMSSGEFLDTYTIPVPTGSLFPAVALKMSADRDLKCSFVTEKGCRVYAVRPWSCRMAPLDIAKGEVRFIFSSEHCLGLNEEREWTVGEWMHSQEMDNYDAVEGIMKELPNRVKFTGMDRLDNHTVYLIHMVCFDIDRFRRYVFDTGFLRVFTVGPEQEEVLRSDDVALLRFGLNWLMDGPDLRTTMRLRDELSG